MKKYILSAVVSVALGTAVVHAEEAKTAPAESPVKAEMRLLDKAFKNLLDSLILNTPEAIEEPFHEVHKAKMNTEKALEKGEIKLPKNNDKIKQFVHMDKDFHKKLENLIEASRKKDMKTVQETTHKLLNGCVQCHSKFRN
jgi:cytochrome c556